MNTEDDGRRLRILIYGADTKGIAIPEGGKIPTKRGIAEFAGLHDAQPFQSYDGVVFFHPTFERFEAFMGSGGPAVRRVADQLELDHRGNQVDILFESGGFACALVAESLIAPARCRDDLAPRLVDRLGLLLIAISKRMEPVRSLTDELRPFLSRFAWHEGWFFVPTEARHPRPLADLRREDSMTSFVADERLFVLQALTPKQSETIDYFTSLIDGIVDLRLRLVTELPDWASAFRFEPELALQTRRAELEREGSEIQGQLEGFTAMMRVLSATSDPLVDAVMAVFARTPLKARRVEQFREDLTLVNSSDESIAVVEVKGVTAASRETTSIRPIVTGSDLVMSRISRRFSWSILQ